MSDTSFKIRMVGEVEFTGFEGPETVRGAVLEASDVAGVRLVAGMILKPVEVVDASTFAGLLDAAKKLLAHWDTYGQEQRGHYAGNQYWSPASRSVGTEFIVELRAAVTKSDLPS